MIYYIVKIESNGDETVISSHDNADNATRFLDGLMANDVVLAGDSWETPATYRIDTVPSNEEIRAANALIPPDPHKLPSKNYGMDLPMPTSRYGRWEGVKWIPLETGETREFTVSELFPQGTHVVAYTLTCSECSCEVKNVRTILGAHTVWHNKLLP